MGAARVPSTIQAMTMKRLFVATFVVVSFAAPTEAAADENEACAVAYEQSQLHRRAGRLLDARTALTTCAQATCPAFLVNECVPALRDIEEAIPSIVVAVRDPGGKATVDGELVIDDKVRPSPIPSTAIPLDPGTH